MALGYGIATIAQLKEDSVKAIAVEVGIQNGTLAIAIASAPTFLNNSTATNKVIAITGASSGIGAASAKLLAKNGAKVVLGARRIQKLAEIVEAIRDRGGTAEYKALDVTDRVDVILNNAGVMPLSPMKSLSDRRRAHFEESRSSYRIDYSS